MNRNGSCKIRLDGRELQVPSGKSLLGGALEAGVYIPHLCFHRDLPPARTARPVEAVYRAGERIENDGGEQTPTGCGLCVVELDGAGEPRPACDLEVTPGMEIRTDTPALRARRQQSLARILGRHPHACITCAQKEGCSREPCSTGVDVTERCCPLLGRCELEKVACYVGVSADTPRYVPHGLPVERDDAGLFVFAPELCVACLRCVRACRDLKGVDALGFVYSGGEIVVGRTAAAGTETACRFCGACVEVCPTGALTDRVETQRLVPCRSSCPAGMDVPRFLRDVAAERFEDAGRVCLDRLPLPNTLGRVCFHPCEEGCRRIELGGALSVCRLRRAVFDRVDPGQHPWPEPATTGRRVAVIGSGPAGLSAAHFLRRMGREVTVFEAAAEAGGMLRYGIPEYRLERVILDRDLTLLRGQGIEIRTGMALGRELSLRDLREQGFDAVLVAAGAGAARPLDVEGADRERVLRGVGFLRDVANGSFPEGELRDREVVVIGGGDVAVDAARTAVRLGARSVTLVCLEAEGEMPAHETEIEEARREGVRFTNGWGPAAILGPNGDVSRVRLIRCIEVFDASGRFAPRFDAGTTRELAADAVIAAIGQEVERDLREQPELTFGREGWLSATPEGIFAAGDVVSGPSSVVHSLAGGRAAAEAIDRYLGGSGEVPSILEAETPSQWTGRGEGFATRARAEGRLAADAAPDEAGRCLQCDLRLRIAAPVLPPPPWIALTAEAVAGVPAAEGVYQLLGEDHVAVKIQGTADLRQALEEELGGDETAPCFIYEEDPMYSKRESELIQQFLALHGRMPAGGDDDLDDLF